MTSRRTKAFSYLRHGPILAIALLPALGCKDQQTVQGKVLTQENRKPISDAVVYIHTSQGNIFDRNQVKWIISANTDGSFVADQIKGRLEGIYAIAPGRYPGFATGGDEIRLRSIPSETLEKKRGSISLATSGEAWGFRFSNGSGADAKVADLVPIFKTGQRRPIRSIGTQGDGGFLQIPSDSVRAMGTSTHVKVACVLANALEAPDVGYQKEIELTENLDVFWVRCSDGKHYAKVLECYQSTAPDGLITWTFDYVFQPRAGDRIVASKVTIEGFEDSLGAGKSIDLRTPN